MRWWGTRARSASGGLGGADIQLPVDLEGVGVDDLGPEALPPGPGPPRSCPPRWRPPAPPPGVFSRLGEELVPCNHLRRPEPSSGHEPRGKRGKGEEGKRKRLLRRELFPLFAFCPFHLFPQSFTGESSAGCRRSSSGATGAARGGSGRRRQSRPTGPAGRRWPRGPEPPRP